MLHEKFQFLVFFFLDGGKSCFYIESEKVYKF